MRSFRMQREVKRKGSGNSTSAEVLLRSCELKVTGPRVTVLRLMIGNPAPLSVQEIVSAASAHTLDESTIYRIIRDFVSKNLIKQIPTGSGPVLYEWEGQKTHHHHIICEMCGTMEDVIRCGPSEMMDEILKEAKRFSSIHRHMMEFYGLCSACSRK